MGEGNGHGGPISDVNFFPNQRNDIPQQPSNMHREVYQDWQPSAPGRCPPNDGRVGQQDRVAIRDGQNIIYANNVYINGDGGGYQRTGWNPQNGYIPNFDDTYRQLQMRNQAQWEMASGYRQPYYDPRMDPRYRNINSNGWETPCYNNNNVGNGVASFFGAFLGAFAGSRAGGGRYGGYNGGWNQPVYVPDCYGNGGYNNGWNTGWNPGYNTGYNRGGYCPPYYGNNYGRGRGGVSINFGFRI